MPVILPNVIVNTSRSVYSSATGQSNTPTTRLLTISGHIGPIPATEYIILPASALESKYKLKVDTGTDIHEGDSITSITLLDGITPWPATRNNELWSVMFTDETDPGPLAHRKVYLGRFIGGGKSN